MSDESSVDRRTQRRSSVAGLMVTLLLATTAPLLVTPYARAQTPPVSANAHPKGAQAAIEPREVPWVELAAGQMNNAKKAAAALRDPVTTALVDAYILHSQGRTDEAIALCIRHTNASGTVGMRARVATGELLIARGKRSEARPHLLSVIDDYNEDRIAPTDWEGLALAGRAAALLRSAKDANQLYQKSEKAGKGHVEPLLLRAELFFDKEDFGHAEEVLQEVLGRVPAHAGAKTWLARVKMGQALDFAQAHRLLDEAIRESPAFGDAYFAKAALVLRDMDLTAAERIARDGLARAKGHLALQSILAATRFLAEDRAGFDRLRAQILAQNGQYATFFTIVADAIEWEHRYDDIVRLMEEATRVDPGDSRAWSVLGLTRMRSGDETRGLADLRTAWSKDHFDVRVYNTLNLYEKSIAVDYASVDDGPFSIRYPSESKAVLERYVPHVLARAWASMRARYGITPPSPIHVELYRNREHFSVRTSGLPNIGIQGVCFGNVIAAMGPGSEPFNWGNVLWHELGHVFAIHLSKSRVPRWYTEGLSEYETLVQRPEWRRSLDPPLFAALKSGRLPSVGNMNRAFTHAEDGLAVSVAYYASSQMVLFAVERFGMGRNVSALRAWGEGLPSSKVLPGAFGITESTFDNEFRAWASKRLARFDGQFVPEADPRSIQELEDAFVREGKKSAALLAQVAWKHLAEGRADAAKQSLDRARALNPKDSTTRFVAARFARAKGDADAEERELRGLVRDGNDGYVVQMTLAELSRGRKDAAALRTALAAAHRFDPTQDEPLRGLVDLARSEGRRDEEFALLRALAPLSEHDARIAHALGNALAERADWRGAYDVGESLLYQDVLSPETHLLLGRAAVATGRLDVADYEAESARLCMEAAATAAPGAKPPGPLDARLAGLRAHVAHARGATSDARRWAKEAKAADPKFTDLPPGVP